MQLNPLPIPTFAGRNRRMTTQRIILVVVPIPDKPEEFAGF